jgi:hypothetical protein
MVWGMVWYGMVWYGMVWYGMVWYCMVWYGLVWYGILWFGMVWYGMVRYLVVGEVARRNETHVAQLTGVGPEKEQLIFTKPVCSVMLCYLL